MRLVAAIVITGGLAATAAWVPIEGRTLWQRAEAHGLPGTAARAVGTAARTVGTAAAGTWRWANSTSAARSVRRPGEAEHSPVGKAGWHAKAGQGTGHAESAHGAASRAAPGSPASSIALPAAGASPASPALAPLVPGHVASAPRTLAAAPAAPPKHHDGIVPAAAPEELSDGDRAALDRLVGSAGNK
jgi:hypothetical protein